MNDQDSLNNSLNSNIPEGRGMIKWAPFATMPEQFENVDTLVSAQTKIDRPVLSDDRLDELEHTLNTAVNEKKIIKVFYYYDGYRFDVSLEIIKIDRWSMMLIGQKYRTEDFVFVPFIDILDIVILGNN